MPPKFKFLATAAKIPSSPYQKGSKSEGKRKIKIRNPNFEKIEKKYVKAIISEYGILSYADFIRRAEKTI